MSKIIDTRSEILFIYDIADANPNGDPNDENRPRFDRESGRVKVTDVRLKRTIRDYLHDALGLEIFCREIEKEDGTIQAGKDRAEDFFTQVKDNAAHAANVREKCNTIEKGVLEKCIDVRLFGATIPVAKTKQNEKDSSVTLTGAVQFAMGGSLHRAEVRFVKGTGAFASGQGRERKTFREEYVLPYGLIAFYGIVNHQVAKTTKLTEEDVDKLYEAIWFGTKGLITRSKIGQRPLLLLVVEYKKEHANSYIGRLDRFVDLELDVPRGASGDFREEAIRGPEHFKVDLSKLRTTLFGRKEKIAKLRYALDSRLRLSGDGPTDSEFLGIAAKRFADFD